MVLETRTDGGPVTVYDSFMDYTLRNNDTDDVNARRHYLEFLAKVMACYVHLFYHVMVSPALSDKWNSTTRKMLQAGAVLQRKDTANGITLNFASMPYQQLGSSVGNNACG